MDLRRLALRWCWAGRLCIALLACACGGDSPFEPPGKQSVAPAAGSGGRAGAAGTRVDAGPAPAAGSGTPADAGSGRKDAGDSRADAATQKPPPVDAATPIEPAATRPASWDPATHGNDVRPNHAEVFADDRVKSISIEMSAETRQKMLDEMTALLGPPGQPIAGLPMSLPVRGEVIDDLTPTPAYFPVTVRQDQRVWTHVGMRYKGNSTLYQSWHRKSLKISFRLHFDHFEDAQPQIEDQRYHGFRELVFAAGFGDGASMRDKIASEVMRGVGMPAARSAFYRVFVDVGQGPEYWGLFTLLEDPTDSLIKTDFVDDSGNMYKPDGPGADFTRFDSMGFPKKTNEAARDWSDVERAVAALHAPRTAAETWRGGLEAAFDVDGFVRWLAFSRVLNHFDGYGTFAHNYFLYGDPAKKGRLVWIGWDHNNMLASANYFPKLSVMMDEVDQTWPLIRYVMDDQVYRERYREALRVLLEGPCSKSRFDARVQQLHEMITPFVTGAEGERAPYTHLANPNQFRSALTSLITAADARREEVRQALAGGN